MALFGLFGNKNEDPQPKDAFFLDDEVAKSMGDTSYMKQPKSIRRTYPKGGGGEEFEMVKVVSAMKSSVNDSRKEGSPKRIESQPAATTSTYTAASSFGSSASSFGSAPSSFGSSASSFGSSASSFSAPAPTPAPAPEAPAPTPAPAPAPEAQTRRKSSGDDGLDMFRKMAKSIR